LGKVWAEDGGRWVHAAALVVHTRAVVEGGAAIKVHGGRVVAPMVLTHGWDRDGHVGVVVIGARVRAAVRLVVAGAICANPADGLTSIVD